MKGGECPLAENLNSAAQRKCQQYKRLEYDTKHGQAIFGTGVISRFLMRCQIDLCAKSPGYFLAMSADMPQLALGKPQFDAGSEYYGADEKGSEN
jgi:hypothetical protein